MTTRRIGPRGLAIIKQYEGLRLTAYLCPAKVWTIGYGSTGPAVKPGMTITAERGEALLKEDLERFEKAVSIAAPTATQNQFDAMVSLAFNVGEANFNSSTLLRRHRAGQHALARSEFARWNKSRGKVLAGLTRRRASEAALYAA
jgi:lysozyme